MFRQIDQVHAARIGLAVGAAAWLGVMAGPFQDTIFVLAPARFGAAFGLTLLAFLAAPKLRRNDIALAALALTAAFELVRGAVGAGIHGADILAGAAGVGFAWLPAATESARRTAKRSPFEPLVERRVKRGPALSLSARIARTQAEKAAA